MNPKQLFGIAASALLLLAAGAANAGEKLEGSSQEAFNTTLWDVLELDEGHSLAWWRGEGIAFEDDPSVPMHLMAADCIGTYEFMPDETYKVTGFCTYIDRDGDKTFLKWWDNSDMEEGRTEFIGGTGRYAGATGEGTYTGQKLSDTLVSFEHKYVIELP